MINEPVSLAVDGLNLTGRFYLPGGADLAPYPAVCICHGIPSGAPPDPADGGYPELAERICREGLAVFIFNFRGTGTSGGNLDMAGWSRDLQAVIDYLHTLPEVDGTRLSLLGFSGGAAVSVFVAAQDSRVASVIACACPAEFTLANAGDPASAIERFRNIGAIRDQDFPSSAEDWVRGFDLVCPVKYVDRIAPRPLLLVHGGNDETVEVGHAYRLYQQAGEPKHLIIIGGAGHRLRKDATAMAIVMNWLESRC